MGTFNLAITYPDGQQTRILNALKAVSGTSTNAAAIEWLRGQVVQRLKDEVRGYENGVALAAVTDSGVT